MHLDDPEERRDFRKQLLRLGLAEVRYRLGAQKYSNEKVAVVKQWIADFEAGATIADELLDVCNALDALKDRFVDGGNLTGMFLPTDDRATFKGLFLKAKTLMDEGLGTSSEYLREFASIYDRDLGDPSFASVVEMVEVIDGAIKQIQRKPQSPGFPGMQENSPYVDPSRLADIRNASSTKYDFRRLVEMCVELNAAYARRNYICVAMLVRAIIDHVPPVFNKSNFGEVANNHGGQSFKASMKGLNESMRKISDSYLHQHIRQKETLPSAVQVDVRRELDFLLAEVVRLT